MSTNHQNPHSSWTLRDEATWLGLLQNPSWKLPLLPLTARPGYLAGLQRRYWNFTGTGPFKAAERSALEVALLHNDLTDLLALLSPLLSRRPLAPASRRLVRSRPSQPTTPDRAGATGRGVRAPKRMSF